MCKMAELINNFEVKTGKVASSEMNVLPERSDTTQW